MALAAPVGLQTAQVTRSLVNTTMTLEQLKLFTIAPEIALFVLLAVVMLADAFLKKRSEVLVHMGSLAGLVFIGLWQMLDASPSPQQWE